MEGSCARSRQYKLKKYLRPYAGTITWALGVLDQHFSDEDIRRLPDYARELVEEYACIDGRGDHILCWDRARFYNHSCDANCLGVWDDFQMAARDSQPERS
jgi:hypothetical protein